MVSRRDVTSPGWTSASHSLRCRRSRSIISLSFVDLFILRRQRLDIRAMDDSRPGSPYHYTSGFNLVAFISMASGAVVCAVLLDPIDSVPVEAFRWLTASIPSMAVSGILHFVLTRAVSIPRGKGRFASRSETGSERD